MLSFVLKRLDAAILVLGAVTNIASKATQDEADIARYTQDSVGRRGMQHSMCRGSEYKHAHGSASQ